MNNLKYAIDGLMKKPFIFFITVLQLIVGSFLLSNGLIAKLTVDDINMRTESLFKDKSAYRLMDITSNSTSKENLNQPDSIKRLDELYSFLKNNKNFKLVSFTNTNILIENFITEDKFYCNKNEKYVKSPISNQNFSNIKVNYVDEDFIKQFPLQVSEGRPFTSNDFSYKGEMPVILGASYKGYYKVGDKLNYYNIADKKNETLVVIGRLKSDYYFVSGGSIINLDNSIICPCVKLNPSTALMPEYDMRIFQSVLITNNKDKALEEIRSKNKELKLYSVDLVDYKQYFIKINELMTASARTTTILSIIILLFTSIGIITSLLNIIKKRFTEFGIHLLSGASLKDITLRIFYSVIFYIAIGFLGGVYLNYVIYPEVFDIRILSYIIPISVLQIMVVSYLPLQSIKKIEVSSIIRRKE